MHHRLAKDLLLLASCAVLAGCGLKPGTDTNIENAGSAVLNGTVHGGQNPVASATVELLAVATSTGGTPAVLASGSTDANGNFNLGPSACTDPNAPVYLVALGGNAGSGTNSAIAMMTAVGVCSTMRSSTVVINEVTTVVAAYALSQYHSSGVNFGGPGSGTSGASGTVYSVGLRNAIVGTIPSLLNTATGTVKANTASLTIDSAKIYSLANAIAACVNSTGSSSTSCSTLFTNTRIGSATPTDTLSAAVNVALAPYQNVSALFGLSSGTAPFGGALSSTPNDWTIGVNRAMPGNGSVVTEPWLAVDALGGIWAPGGSANVAVRLSQADYSTASSFSSGQTGAVSGVAIAANGTVYVPTGTRYLTVLTPTSSALTSFTSATVDLGPAVYAANSAWNNSRYSLATLAAALDDNSKPVVSVRVADSSNNGATVAAYVLGPALTSSACDSSGSGYCAIAYPSAVVNPGNMHVDNQNAIISIDNATSLAYDDYIYRGGSSTSTHETYAETNPGYSAASKSGDTLITRPTASQVCNYTATCEGSSALPGISAPRGMAVDGDDYLWLANSGTSSFMKLNDVTSSSSVVTTASNNVIYLHGSSYGATASALTSLVIDQSGNVWSFNQSGNSSSLTELIGAAAPTIQPIINQYAGGTNLFGTRPTN